MITDNLYKQILIDPASSGNDELFIVSGYSSATFLNRHLNEIVQINPEIRLNLLIGMHQKRNDHSAYLNIKSIPKLFLWLLLFRQTWSSFENLFVGKRWSPKYRFFRSANYSQYGFLNTLQQNQMVEDDPLIKNYFETLREESLNIEDYIPTEDDSPDMVNVEGSLMPGMIEWIKYNESVRISLLLEMGKWQRGVDLTVKDLIRIEILIKHTFLLDLMREKRVSFQKELLHLRC